MARIRGVTPEHAGLVTRLFYRIAERMAGKVPEPMTISALHPQIFQAGGAYEFFLGRARRVPQRLKTLASIKAAMLIGCPF